MSDNKPQRDKFIDKAREIGCDEDEAAFEKKLKRIVPRPEKKDGGPAMGRRKNKSSA